MCLHPGDTFWAHLADTWLLNYIVATSLKQVVQTTLLQHYFKVACQLGKYKKISTRTTMAQYQKRQ